MTYQAPYWSNEHPERWWRNRAHRRVAAALSAGQLIRPDRCERCGRAAQVQGHHASYLEDRVLDIEWLCPACHYRRDHESPAPYPEDLMERHRDFLARRLERPFARGRCEALDGGSTDGPPRNCGPAHEAAFWQGYEEGTAEVDEDGVDDLLRVFDEQADLDHYLARLCE